MLKVVCDASILLSKDHYEPNSQARPHIVQGPNNNSTEIRPVVEMRHTHWQTRSQSCVTFTKFVQMVHKDRCSSGVVLPADDGQREQHVRAASAYRKRYKYVCFEWHFV
jgi:hypothetical protein